MHTMIETTQLSKHYRDFKALDQVSVTVEKGDIYGLIGKNGAGKTTLFRLLMGLSRQTSGSMTINDSSNLHDARQQIGFMISPSFFPYFNARQNIEYYRKMKGIKDPAETDRVLKLVDLFGIKKPFRSFSMGMKQRLGIANALLGNPSIVILDEPINGLDPQGISDIRTMIRDLREQHGTTFILSSHVLSELDLVATKFGFIDHGVLVNEISHEELHQHTQSALTIQVDNTDKAAALISEFMHTKNYMVSPQNELILEDCAEQSNKIAKLLISHNLELYSLHKKETTLEEYFISLVGGQS